MRIVKRYQVFISSTREDLIEERRVVTDGLLRGEYIPIGMEHFPADDRDAWTLIQEFIDQCDYYIVIVAGKYGSTLPNGISYTENEYDYALLKGKPILAFLHEDINALPGGKLESDSVKRDQLKRFREKIEGARVRDVWNDKYELAYKVVGALDRYIKSNPAIGWIRGDVIPANFDSDIKQIVEPCKSQGITFVSQHGIAESTRMISQLRNSREIRIMATSATRLLEIYRPSLIQTLINGADVKVLVPKPGSDFVRDVEEAESMYVKREGIDREIMNVEERLKDCLAAAQTNPGATQSLGSASVGFFTTHLRSTLVLCDDWGWLTITLPPLRAPETVSFELEKTGVNCLLNSCISHFDRTWHIVKSRGDVRQI